MRILPFVLAPVVLIGAALAQDKPGAVRVVASKEIWKADGMTVTHAQFTPDGKRIVFVAQSKNRFLLASVRPDGTALLDLHTEDAAPTRFIHPPSIDNGTVSVMILSGEEILWIRTAPNREGSANVVRGKAKGDALPIPHPGQKCVASSPDGALFAHTKDLPSPVGIVRGAGLWVRGLPDEIRSGPPVLPGRSSFRQVLSPKDWLVGVAYYKHMIAWVPPKKGEKESRRIRFIGARIKPFPGLKHRPLCVWEVAINDKLERVGEPVRLGTFGWWPRFFRGDPALHGATAWNVGIGGGQYMADFRTGKVYKFAAGGFGRVNATYSPDCSLVALPGKTIRVLKLEKKE